MFKAKAAFSGFSVDDLSKARKFYSGVLGLSVDDEEGRGVRLHLPGGGTVFVYPKADHQAATFTILNFIVDNIDDGVTVAGYATIIDNTSGDATFVKAQPAP